MVDKIIKVQWSGVIVDGTTATSPLVEIWSNSCHVLVPDTVDLVTMLAEVQAGLTTFFGTAANHISDTVRIKSIKANEIDPATGLQITDPTNEVDVDIRGNSFSQSYPTTVSCRVSMDNGTRNRRARGGFYLPRTTLTVARSGRFISEEVAVLVTNLQTLLHSFEPTTASFIGVYSRAAAGFFPSSELRVGDVPDNIRRRKNDMVEAYQVATL